VDAHTPCRQSKHVHTYHDTNAGAHGDSYPVAHPDAKPDGNIRAHGDTYAHSERDTDVDRNSDTLEHAYAHIVTLPVTHTDGNPRTRVHPGR
jgi:hypothetical protein